jgi:hypothetical protein
MKKQDIINAIIMAVGGTSYSSWRIGLTNDPATRKAYWRDTEKEDVTTWKQWPADSLKDAQDIETLFIGKGMKGGTGGDLSDNETVYVYIF